MALSSTIASLYGANFSKPAAGRLSPRPSSCGAHLVGWLVRSSVCRPPPLWVSLYPSLASCRAGRVMNRVYAPWAAAAGWAAEDLAREGGGSTAGPPVAGMLRPCPSLRPPPSAPSAVSDPNAWWRIVQLSFPEEITPRSDYAYGRDRLQPLARRRLPVAHAHPEPVEPRSALFPRRPQHHQAVPLAHLRRDQEPQPVAPQVQHLAVRRNPPLMMAGRSAGRAILPRAVSYPP